MATWFHPSIVVNIGAVCYVNIVVTKLSLPGVSLSRLFTCWPDKDTRSPDLAAVPNVSYCVIVIFSRGAQYNTCTCNMNFTWIAHACKSSALICVLCDIQCTSYFCQIDIPLLMYFI